ncbi:MAG: peptidylprolyl isomerase [Balneolales bacterium]
MKDLHAIWIVGLVLLLASCGHSEEIERLQRINSELNEKIRIQEQKMNELENSHTKLNFLASKTEGVKARMITSLGEVEIEFYPDKAPIHAFNFITRAESGFYDQTRFHRVIPGFMIQGGDPNSKDENPYNNGQGGPIIAIPHEFNDINHSRGVLSMARTGDKSAGAGSQFFVMHANSPHLNNEYTAFGKVTSGMEVIDTIADSPTNQDDARLRDQPIEPVIIERIEVYR